MPPGTLPPVVLPFDPTSTTPVALVTLDSKTQDESILYDVARYEVRNFIMQQPGAVAPVVIGGKIRAVMLYLDATKMQARKLSPRRGDGRGQATTCSSHPATSASATWIMPSPPNSMFDLSGAWGKSRAPFPVRAKTGGKVGQFRLSR